MVKKMSNKEKIQQKVEEVVAGIKEKTEKKEKKVKKQTKLQKEKKTTPSKKTTKPPDRKKIVWKVFNDSFKEVDCFPYLEKEKAYLRATELTRTKNKNYFVNEVCVPMVEE